MRKRCLTRRKTNKRRLLANENRKRSRKLRSKLRKRLSKRKELKIKLMLKLEVKCMWRNLKSRKTRRRNRKRRRKIRLKRVMTLVMVRRTKSSQARRGSVIKLRKMLKSLIRRSSLRMSQNLKAMTKTGFKVRKMKLVMRRRKNQNQQKKRNQ